MPHLLIDLTYHGFGHVGQTAPVIERLRELMPGLKITIRSSVSRRHLFSRFSEPFRHIPKPTDIGIPMIDFQEVDRTRCFRAYVDLHQDWTGQVEGCARKTAALAPDLVLSNASYLALAGARKAGIPSIAYGSLNWADLFAFYAAGRPGAGRIFDQIRTAYGDAGGFLALTPGMPVEWLPNAIPIGPVAQVGQQRRGELAGKLGLPADARLVLVAFGGMPVRIDSSRWPDIRNTHFLVPSGWRTRPECCTPIDTIGIPFVDLVKSCDAVIAKPGYGIVAEAACNGTAFLSIPRADWPEQGILLDWLSLHCAVRTITLQDLATGNLAPALDAVVPTAGKRPVECPAPTGIDEAAGMLRGMLNGCRASSGSGRTTPETLSGSAFPRADGIGRRDLSCA